MVNNTEKNEQEQQVPVWRLLQEAAVNRENKHYSAANSAGSTDTSPGG